MEKGKNNVRGKMIVVRMNSEEFDSLENLRKRTTERTTSSYIRKVALSIPVIIKYRNSSADEFLAQMLELKKDLNGIGNNFNQAVHKLHMIDKIPEFRVWIAGHGNIHIQVTEKIAEMKTLMIKIYEQWSQS